MRLRNTAAVLAGLITLGPLAWAGDPAAAEELFRLGREAMERGDVATACDKFAASQKLDPAAGTLMNLGRCEARRGRVASAWQAYRQAADSLVGDDRRAEAVRAAQELEPRLSRLTVELDPAAPAGATVFRDGAELERGSLGAALPIDPGEHVIVVRAPDRQQREYRVTLSEARSETLLVTAGAQTGAEAQPSHGLAVAGYVIGGLGLASLGVGIVTGVMTMGRKSTVEENCVDSLCNQAGVDAADSGRTLSAVSTATFVVGLAALGTGILFVALDASSDSSEGEPAPSVGLAASVSPYGSALQVVGRF